jgi:hypothetical protein
VGRDEIICEYVQDRGDKLRVPGTVPVLALTNSPEFRRTSHPSARNRAVDHTI